MELLATLLSNDPSHGQNVSCLCLTGHSNRPKNCGALGLGPDKGDVVHAGRGRVSYVMVGMPIVMQLPV